MFAARNALFMILILISCSAKAADISKFRRGNWNLYKGKLMVTNSGSGASAVCNDSIIYFLAAQATVCIRGRIDEISAAAVEHPNTGYVTGIWQFSMSEASDLYYDQPIEPGIVFFYQGISIPGVVEFNRGYWNEGDLSNGDEVICFGRVSEKGVIQAQVLYKFDSSGKILCSTSTVDDSGNVEDCIDQNRNKRDVQILVHKSDVIVSVFDLRRHADSYSARIDAVMKGDYNNDEIVFTRGKDDVFDDGIIWPDSQRFLLCLSEGKMGLETVGGIRGVFLLEDGKVHNTGGWALNYCFKEENND